MNTENSSLAFKVPKGISAWLDMTGFAASRLCAMHCLALPLALSILPLIGLGVLLSETTEMAFIGISILIAALSLLPAYFREHHRLRAILFFTSGICLLVISRLLFEESLVLKAVFLITGGTLLTTAHFVNRRLCRECEVCQAHTA